MRLLLENYLFKDEILDLKIVFNKNFICGKKMASHDDDDLLVEEGDTTHDDFRKNLTVILTRTKADELRACTKS